jgi:hypothetical protein
VLHVGVKTGGTAAAPVITQIGEFEAPNDSFGLQLVFDESTRDTKRIRGQGSDFWVQKTRILCAMLYTKRSLYQDRLGTNMRKTQKDMRFLQELYEALMNQTTNKGPVAPNQIAPFTAGAVPTHVPVVGSFFDAPSPAGGGNKNPTCDKCGAEYTKAQAAMQDMFGITTYSMPACTDSLPAGTTCTNDKMYIDIRGCIASPEAIEKCLQVYVNESTTDAILVVSLGDEISVVDPNPNNTLPDKFAAWCTAEGHAGKPGCGGTVDTAIASAKGDATVKKRSFCAIYRFKKTVILPRQARDKHRESTQKRRDRFLADQRPLLLLTALHPRHRHRAIQDPDGQDTFDPATSARWGELQPDWIRDRPR